MTWNQERLSRVSTVLAVVFGGLTGLYCLVPFIGAVAALVVTGRVVSPLVPLALAYGACAGLCLIGGALLLKRRESGITAVTTGGVGALLIVLIELVIGALPENAATSDPTGLGPLLLFAVLALVQVRRKDTRHWIGQ